MRDVMGGRHGASGIAHRTFVLKLADPISVGILVQIS
jgi:hypothetical protein